MSLGQVSHPLVAEVAAGLDNELPHSNPSPAKVGWKISSVGRDESVTAATQVSNASYAAAAAKIAIPAWCLGAEKRVFVSVASSSAVVGSLAALGSDVCVCWEQGKLSHRSVYMFANATAYADWVENNPQFLSVAVQRPCDSGRFGNGSALRGQVHIMQLRGIIPSKPTELGALARAIAAACSAPVLAVLPRECRVLLWRCDSFVEPAAGRVAGVSWGEGSELQDSARSVAFALPPPLCRGHSESFVAELRRRLEESPVGQCSVTISWRRVSGLSIWFCRVTAAASIDVLLEQLRGTCLLGERVVASSDLQQLFESIVPPGSVPAHASAGAQRATAAAQSTVGSATTAADAESNAERTATTEQPFVQPRHIMRRQQQLQRRAAATTQHDRQAQQQQQQQKPQQKQQQQPSSPEVSSQQQQQQQQQRQKPQQKQQRQQQPSSPEVSSQLQSPPLRRHRKRRQHRHKQLGSLTSPVAAASADTLTSSDEGTLAGAGAGAVTGGVCVAAAAAADAEVDLAATAAAAAVQQQQQQQQPKPQSDLQHPPAAAPVPQQPTSSPLFKLPSVRKRIAATSVPRGEDGVTSSNFSKHVEWASESESDSEVEYQDSPLPPPTVTECEDLQQQPDGADVADVGSAHSTQF